MRRLSLSALFIGLTFLSVPASATERLSAEKAVADRVLGRADAPITMIEYASLTCPHCADFEEAVLPEIKKDYIDTGKVKLIFRDFPFDGVALRGAALARCMPNDMYFNFKSVLFRAQKSWIVAKDPAAELVKYGKMAGLSAEDAKACMDDEAIQDGIMKKMMEGKDAYQINSTPSFVLQNGAEKIIGARPAADFKAVFDRLLAQGKKAP
jgi:protein-disulfide isomerase